MNATNICAIILGLATALAAGVVGSFGLMKRMTLAGDVVSHLALPGLGAAFLWKINPIAGAAVTVGLGIILIHQLERRSGLAIETAMFGILVAIYFSVMMNTEPFPPPRMERFPVLYQSYPDHTLPLIGLAVIVASLVPGIFLDKAARNKQVGMIKILLPITLAFNIAAIFIRYFEFDSLPIPKSSLHRQQRFRVRIVEDFVANVLPSRTSNETIPFCTDG